MADRVDAVMEAVKAPGRDAPMDTGVGQPAGQELGSGEDAVVGLGEFSDATFRTPVDVRFRIPKEGVHAADFAPPVAP